jgi:uncharacterized protein YceH (UPF0502 family)
MIEIPDQLVLTGPEARVLGALMEKRRTTPDVYPMTLKAVTTACNQSTSRDPVVDYDERLVDDTLGRLKAKGLVRMVHPGAGERSTKFRHVVDEALGLDDAATAVLCVLLLRGPQTAAELKARTERIHRFDSTGQAEAALQDLADHHRNLAVQLERLPGHKERRWQQLLTEPAALSGQATDAGPAVGVPGSDPATATDAGTAGISAQHAVPAISELVDKISALERRLDQLVEALGDLVDVTHPHDVTDPHDVTYPNDGTTSSDS